nr:MAG TPA: hypothetical protein [Caudoviricetes sp.]
MGVSYRQARQSTAHKSLCSHSQLWFLHIHALNSRMGVSGSGYGSFYGSPKH